jgi:hypothetical protein
MSAERYSLGGSFQDVPLSLPLIPVRVGTVL